MNWLITSSCSYVQNTAGKNVTWIRTGWHAGTTSKSHQNTHKKKAKYNVTTNFWSLALTHQIFRSNIRFSRSLCWPISSGVSVHGPFSCTLSCRDHQPGQSHWSLPSNPRWWGCFEQLSLRGKIWKTKESSVRKIRKMQIILCSVSDNMNNIIEVFHALWLGNWIGAINTFVLGADVVL